MAKKNKRDLFGGRGQAKVFNDKALAWWREARFGMFIHWGVYALPAGVWKGKESEKIGEWLMHTFKIPRAEYEGLAGRFNPVKFDARQWVALAKEAGMKYMVITAKHHDGFAMFDSPSSPYNIVAATPFKRDPMKELSKACAEAGIKFCFYYSQDQDWHDPDGAWNDWDFDPAKKDFRAYMDRKVKPQLKELLTQYGPIGLIWFDTPYTISAEHSKELADYVRSLQPDCLVSGRIGHDLGDYGSLGDNQLPAGRIDGDYETPATMNDTWGYKTGDRTWKSAETLRYLLTDLAGKGVNYLLNVGPTAEGEIPPESVDRLKSIGAWMRVNGEAIYGTRPNPFPVDFPWGRVTEKGRRLYLILYSWPTGAAPTGKATAGKVQSGAAPGGAATAGAATAYAAFTLYGLKNRVLKAYCLADPSKPLTVHQEQDRDGQRDVLRLGGLASIAPELPGVVALELDGPSLVEQRVIQQPDGTLWLPSYMADIHQSASAALSISRPGFTKGWTNKKAWLSWTFVVYEAGEYAVRIVSAKPHGELPPSGTGHGVTVEIAGQTLAAGIREDEPVDDPRARYFPERITIAGRCRIPKPGTYTLKLRVRDFIPGEDRAVAVSGIGLRKQD
jgi:alpha-L-fucosidase